MNKVKYYIINLIANLSILPRLLINFTIKSLIYIFILILQCFLPFSYIILDILINIIGKLLLRYKNTFNSSNLLNLLKFREGFLTFIRHFKNQIEYNI